MSRLARRFALIVLALALGGAAKAPFDPMNAREATTFPRAHGAHPGSPLEWWYLTGRLDDGDGRSMGFQVTFFRARIDVAGAAPPVELRSAWRPGDVYFAHYALSDLKSRFYRFDERIGRTSVALAGADSTDLHVWIRDWSLKRLPTGAFRVHAAGDLGELSLDLTPSRPQPVAWGPQYFSAKNASGTSFSRYHSDPRMRAKGTYTGPGAPARDVRGTVWYDHEWSGGVYDSTLKGWDWFGLRLQDGRSVMLYRMRDRTGATSYLFGGIVDRAGRVRTFTRDEVTMNALRYWTSAKTGARYPLSWDINIQPPGESPLRLQVSAALSDQELTTERSTRVAYWEGYVEGKEQEADPDQRVEGYMELTGYAGGGVPGRVSSVGR
ncbi:MAG TPA: lipocalin-like domain-containing protein [Candidatus Eisenbacteria bacterium]|nr:lipocalin-like domain-containing protein [Candidatus Eisenbacteria bacterium]